VGSFYSCCRDRFQVVLIVATLSRPFLSLRLWKLVGVVRFLVSYIFLLPPLVSMFLGSLVPLPSPLLNSFQLVHVISVYTHNLNKKYSPCACRVRTDHDMNDWSGNPEAPAPVHRTLRSSLRILTPPLHPSVILHNAPASKINLKGAFLNNFCRG